MASDRSFFGISAIPFRLVFIMWLTYSVQFFYHIDFGMFGVHLLSNTFPLLFLGTALFFFYDRIGGIVFFRCYLITNSLVWLFSPRVSPHIGASGLIYGLASFLIFFGLIRQDFWSLLISVVVIISYGGIFYGVLPSDPHVSWESHLAGTLVGGVTAFNLAGKKKVSQ
jgi:membrane associated rhomboid family serine protease